MTVMLAVGISIEEKEEDPAKRYIGINIFPWPSRCAEEEEKKKGETGNCTRVVVDTNGDERRDKEGRSAASPALKSRDEGRQRREGRKKWERKRNRDGGKTRKVFQKRGR